jgi:hypothetical protein
MKALLLVTFCLLAQIASAQSKDYSKDVASVDAIISALYEVISGEPGATRDWDRFRNLFMPNTRLIPTRKSPQGDLILHVLTPEDFVTQFASRIPTGFVERELKKTVEQYGTVTHVFSTYETREKANGPVTNRGVNSIQLFNDGIRYHIVNILWCSEALGFPLPDKYLPK